MALLIFSRPLGAGQVLELHGSLDASTAAQLEARIRAVLDSGQKKLFFDLRKLKFVSSSGLSIFLTAYRRLSSGGVLRFFGLTDPVRLVFNAAGLTPRVEIYETEEDAVVGPLP